jgi:hypothetical protein
MANTVIQLKYSTVNATPASLNVGEPAYSFSSGKLFIGNSTNHVLTIGGKYYTDIVDAATNSNTISTLVKRDSNGDFAAGVITANLAGNATSATQLKDTRHINITGDGAGTASFNGTANADITFELTNTGVTAGTYGGSTQIPTFVVDEDGRVTAAANVSVATTLAIAGDTGTDSINLISDTLTVTGRDGITTAVISSNNTVLIDVDNTVVRTTGGQTIGGNLTVSGNLLVQGNTVTYDVQSYVVNDPIVLYANNNSGNSVDLGFVAHYVENSDTKHTGLVRNVATDKWYLFENYGPHIQEDHILNIANPTLVTSNLVANLTEGRIFNLTQAINVADGGTGANTFASGQILLGNGTGALQSLANTNAAGTYANASHVPVITTDVYGRVSSVTNTAISIGASQVTSGLLAVARGGTNNDTYTTGAMLQFDGSKIATLSNTTYVQTGTLVASNTVTGITVDPYGRLTALTTANVEIGTTQITSGILPVERGGIGVNTITTNGVLLGQGTSGITTASSSTEGHVLTINQSGVPTFTMLSGGTF